MRARGLLGALALLGAGAAVVGAGSGRAGAEGSARRVTIAATGDLLVHGRVVAGAREHGGAAGLRRALAGLAEAIRADDLALGNLEVPLTTEEEPLAGGRLPVLGAPPEVADALAATGLDAASVANNHAYDQGARGLALTVDSLRRAGVEPVGAGADAEAARRPVVVERGGLRVALLAFTGPVNRPPRRRDEPMRVARLAPEAALLAAIAAARRRADLVVVSVHWSRDFVPEPTPVERDLAARMVEAGADVVLGTGPHLLHPVERIASKRGEAVVAYSLGNAISPQGYQVSYGRPAKGHRAAVHPGSRDGVLLRLGLEVSPGRRVRAASIEAVPLWTSHDLHRGRAPDIRVVAMEAAPEPVRRARLPAIERALGGAVTLLATRRPSPPP